MARLSIQEIMQSVGSLVNQEPTMPTAGGSEYNLWLEFINRATREWSEANDWEVLKKTYFPGVTGVSMATVSLPQDYKKMATSPKLWVDSLEEGEDFAEIPEDTAGLYQSTDKYVYETGDISSGFSLVFHPGTLASGASLQIVYYSTPTSLASPAQVPLVTDSEFLIDRTIAYIFEGRSDSRFQEQEVKARDRLMQMVENANLSKYNSYSNPQYVMTAPEKKQGFRIGRD